MRLWGVGRCMCTRAGQSSITSHSASKTPAVRIYTTAGGGHTVQNDTSRVACITYAEHVHEHSLLAAVLEAMAAF